jgi:hypothetical protein
MNNLLWKKKKSCVAVYSQKMFLIIYLPNKRAWSILLCLSSCIRLLDVLCKLHVSNILDWFIVMPFFQQRDLCWKMEQIVLMTRISFPLYVKYNTVLCSKLSFFYLNFPVKLVKLMLINYSVYLKCPYKSLNHHYLQL